MSVSQQKLLKVLRAQVAEIDESTRINGYQKQLFDTLAQIVVLEQEHLEASTQIQKKVTDKTQALGQFLVHGKWQPK